jgi:hypothetical protein
LAASATFQQEQCPQETARRDFDAAREWSDLMSSSDPNSYAPTHTVQQLLDGLGVAVKKLVVGLRTAVA